MSQRRRQAGAGSPVTQTPKSRSRRVSTSEDEADTDDDARQNEKKQVVKKGVWHVLGSNNNRKLPLKKGDFMRALDCNAKDFKGIVEQVSGSLEQVFGCRLVGLKYEEGVWTTVEADKAAVFITVSKFPKLDVVDYVPKGVINEKDIVRDVATTVILNSMYAQGKDQEVDEEVIWKLLCKAEVDLCPKQDDLTKILKSELVDPLYLNRIEIKASDGFTTYKYAWGIRAELECDKYGMLKLMAKITDNPIRSFQPLYGELLKDPLYVKRMEKDEKELNRARRRERALQAMQEEAEQQNPDLTDTQQTEDIISTQTQTRPTQDVRAGRPGRNAGSEANVEPRRSGRRKSDVE